MPPPPRGAAPPRRRRLRGRAALACVAGRASTRALFNADGTRPGARGEHADVSGLHSPHAFVARSPRCAWGAAHAARTQQIAAEQPAAYAERVRRELRCKASGALECGACDGLERALRRALYRRTAKPDRYKLDSGVASSLLTVA
jgi:hypothetical protein